MLVCIANKSTLPVTLYQEMKVATDELVHETYINEVVETDLEHQQTPRRVTVPLSTELQIPEVRVLCSFILLWNVLAKYTVDLGCTNILSHHN